MKQKDTASPGVETTPGPSKPMQLRGRQNWKLTKADMETPRGRSETEEDQAYTIKELLVRFTQGLPLNQGNGFYADGDDDPDLDAIDLEDFNRMDITEQEELVNQVSEARKVAEITTKAQKAAKMKKEREEKQARIKAKNEAREKAILERLKSEQK